MSSKEQRIIQLRQDLHQHPELSGQEQHTSRNSQACDFPDELLETGISMFKGIISGLLGSGKKVGKGD
jgi:metal-dependent amidase/aminoacylase/carboxypeptidase family protein